MTLFVSLLSKEESASARVYGYRVLFSIKPRGSNPTSREYIYLYRSESKEVPSYVVSEIEEDRLALEERVKGRVKVFSTELKEANPRLPKISGKRVVI